MSASNLLKQTMSRRTDVALHLAQHCLIIVGLVFALGFITPVSGEPMAEAFQALWPEISASADLAEAAEGRAERGASADSDDKMTAAFSDGISYQFADSVGRRIKRISFLNADKRDS